MSSKGRGGAFMKGSRMLGGRRVLEQLQGKWKSTFERSVSSLPAAAHATFVIDKKICFGNCVAGKDRQMPERRRETPVARQDDVTGRNR
jgi:hypothetical protein